VPPTEKKEEERSGKASYPLSECPEKSDSEGRKPVYVHGLF
jgi:hypothetical protein